jgi:hypothetical protein
MSIHDAALCGWEDLESDSFSIVDAGPLRTPIQNFSINRDKKLNLVLETVIDRKAVIPSAAGPDGNASSNGISVTLSNNLDTEVVASHVRIYCLSESSDGMRQTSFFNRLQGAIGVPHDPAYAVDWLANVSSKGWFFWPEVIDEPFESLEFESVEGESILKTSPRPRKGVDGHCVTLRVDGYQVCLYATHRVTENGVVHPGYILYTPAPTESYRQKIRDCLSFSLGIYLVYLGHSQLHKDGSLLSFEAINGYSLDGRAFELPRARPSPLSTEPKEIDRNALQRMVTSLYSHYDTIGFEQLTWAYWHAVCAMPHIAAAHYGAALEALQRSYFRTAANQGSTKIVDESMWDIVSTSLEASLANLNLPSKLHDIFKNKIGNLNSRSQHSMGQALIDDLGLVLSSREKQAYQARHISAHGKDKDIDFEWMRDLLLLRIRLHRILLAMTNGSDEYYDYFTAGTPVRRLQEPVPGD